MDEISRVITVADEQRSATNLPSELGVVEPCEPVTAIARHCDNNEVRFSRPELLATVTITHFHVWAPRIDTPSLRSLELNARSSGVACPAQTHKRTRHLQVRRSGSTMSLFGWIATTVTATADVTQRDVCGVRRAS